MLKMDPVSKTETGVAAQEQVMDLLTVHVEECERPFKAVSKSPKKLRSSAEKLLPIIVSRRRKTVKAPCSTKRRTFIFLLELSFIFFAVF